MLEARGFLARGDVNWNAKDMFDVPMNKYMYSMKFFSMTKFQTRVKNKGVIWGILDGVIGRGQVGVGSCMAAARQGWVLADMAQHPPLR